MSFAFDAMHGERVYVRYLTLAGLACAALEGLVNDRERLGCMEKRICLVLRIVPVRRLDDSSL